MVTADCLDTFFGWEFEPPSENLCRCRPNAFLSANCVEVQLEGFQAETCIFT